jgi:alpha-ketoglutarate-dependent taurine dioxygenase
MKTSPLQPHFGTIVTAAPGQTVADIDHDAVVALIKERGTVLFTGYGATREDFDSFTDTISEDYMDYKGGGYVRKSVGGGAGEGKALLSTRYDHGREKQMTFGLPLHGEMYYIDNRPQALWFYCVKPADADGQTTACDGAEVYNKLGQKWKDLLHAKRLMFLRVYRDGEWQKIYQTEDSAEACKFAEGNGITVEFDEADKTMRTKYLVSAVLPTKWGGHTAYINNLLTVYMQMQMGRGDTSTVWLEDGSPIPDALMDEVKRVQDELIVDLNWTAGDFAILDNSRALHGRRAFEDTEREVYLRMVRTLPF